jgi:predicted adenylyl cyclase CyaB
MATEVEMKAWVTDRETVRARLEQECSFEREFLKEDVYYLIPGGEAARSDDTPQHDRLRFRVRRDGEHAVCTYKDKSFRSGGEVNEEREFEVSDQAVFEQFLLRIGCEEYVRKTKRGVVYQCSEVHAELSHVSGLGDFLEVEQIVEPRSDEHEGDARDRVAHAEASVRALMERLGVASGAIEPRPYTQLLREGV